VRFFPQRSCLSVLLGTLLVFAAGGCATQQVTSFQRARPLQSGHMEVGASLSMARLPGAGSQVVVDDRGSEGESSFGMPAPAVYFRLGIDERLDLGVQAAPGGLQLEGKYSILDDDEFMMALAGTLGFWGSRAAAVEDDGFEASAPLVLGFALPLATRPLPWLELNLAPLATYTQIHATREAYLETQERDFWSLHSGFRLGVNVAVWRVRINPEIALLGVYRSDRGEGIVGLYPGIGAFLVF